MFAIIEFLLNTNWTFHDMKLLGMYMYIHDRKQLLKVIEALWYASKPSNMDYILSKRMRNSELELPLSWMLVDEILLWVLVVEMASLLHLGWLTQFQMRRCIHLLEIITVFVCFGMGMEWFVYSVFIIFGAGSTPWFTENQQNYDPQIYCRYNCDNYRHLLRCILWNKMTHSFSRYCNFCIIISCESTPPTYMALT